MTKVLLFNQYFTSEKDSPEKILASLPINLLYLASYLKSKRIDCKIYELGIFDYDKAIVENNRVKFGISDAEISTIIRNERPKIIGIGCVYTRHYIDVVAISKTIKKIDPSIKVVLGGNHATTFCEMVLKEQNIDFVVKGEGEITLYELCNAILSSNEDYKKIDGLVYRDENKSIIKTRDRELIKNLDKLPPIAYSILDIRKYAEASRQSPFLMRYPAVGVVSSRGCPGKCVYCTVKAVYGRTWRGRSPDNVVNEIEFLHKEYGIKEFSFLDDSASLNQKRWNEICDEIIDRELDIRWTTPNGIAHWTLDKPTLRKMKTAGCYRVTFGIESGNVKTRKFLGKPYSLLQAKEMIQYANKIGMWTICTNILGFPYETKEAMEDTIEFAKKSGTDFATFYLLAPHVVSDVYSYFKKEGLLDFDFIFSEDVLDEGKYEEMNRILHDGGVSTKYHSSEELKKIQIKAYRSFIIYRAITYLNPLRLLKKIRSIEDFKYTIRLIFTGFQILMKSFYKKTTEALLYE